MTDYVFVHEDGRQKRKRKRTNMTSTQVQRKEPRTPLPTAEEQSRVYKTHLIPGQVGEGMIPVLYSRQPDYFQLPSSALEQVEFFTWSFSLVTVTYAIKANPWQACIPQIGHAPFILDAVRALAIRHRSHLEETRESLAVLELKDKALTSYSQSIGTVPLEVSISASLILIGIDYAESAFGDWMIHLRGVYSMIEAAGGVQRGESDVRLLAQIAQLVWYDTIIALLSRREPVFPREYTEYVVARKCDSQWSLLALNGFPDSAFLDMYDIARAAARASSLSDGDAAVLETKLWRAPFETEQGPNDKDMSALMECWRLGLLLYCTRVFHRGEVVRSKAGLLAEKIMRLIQGIPPNSNQQKQALLPLFLAASEMRATSFRRFALDFCERWKMRSGLWLNQTAIEVLHTVWAAKDERPGEDLWWGDFVNPGPNSGFLFG